MHLLFLTQANDHDLHRQVPGLQRIRLADQTPTIRPTLHHSRGEGRTIYSLGDQLSNLVLVRGQFYSGKWGHKEDDSGELV